MVCYFQKKTENFADILVHFLMSLFITVIYDLTRSYQVDYDPDFKRDVDLGFLI